MSTAAKNVLPRFKSGQPLLEQVTASRLNAMCDAIEANRLQPGRGYRLGRHGVGGTSLEVLSQTGGGSSGDEPFQLYKGKIDPEKLRVFLNSKLFLEYGIGSEPYVSNISNIDEEFECPEDNGAIWLEITLADEVFSSAEIVTGPKWTGYPISYKIESVGGGLLVQTKYYHLIGTVKAVDEDNPSEYDTFVMGQTEDDDGVWIEQRWLGNLMFRREMVDGKIIFAASPWSMI